VNDKFSIDPKTSALLVMDFQTWIVERYAPDKEALLNRTARVIRAARGAQMMVLHVVVGFRPGYPEVSSRNVTFSKVRDHGLLAAGGDNLGIHPLVAPRFDEVVVTKHRVSAFAGTDLEMILRANSIETLLLAGIETSGVVLSTVCHGFDADYRIMVIDDCCSELDEEVHLTLVERFFPKQAAVITSRDVMASL
jgi:nicotinamidase-related amidase